MSPLSFRSRAFTGVLLFLWLARAGLFERVKKYNECGPWAGKLFCGVVALDYLLWRALEWWTPRQSIDPALDFPLKLYKEMSD